jgi:hypothetical protein
MPTLKIGHKGADHIAPGNTPASFDAALAAGVDVNAIARTTEDCQRGIARFLKK